MKKKLEMYHIVALGNEPYIYSVGYDDKKEAIRCIEEFKEIAIKNGFSIDYKIVKFVEVEE